MHQVVKVKNEDMFSIVHEILETDGSVWIRVVGTSMRPFLRDGKDQVLLVKKKFEDIKKGDIVLIYRKLEEQYVLHRVIRKEEQSLFIMGDAQQWLEGPIEQNQLIAVVIAIRYKKYEIKCSNIFLRILVTCWKIVIPFRYKLLKIINFLTKL